MNRRSFIAALFAGLAGLVLPRKVDAGMDRKAKVLAHLKEKGKITFPGATCTWHVGVDPGAPEGSWTVVTTSYDGKTFTTHAR